MAPSLKELRNNRGFDVKYYINEKVKKLNTFFKDEKLDSVVLGLSGGIDSAVALAILLKVAELPGSSLKKVVGMAMPIRGTGSTGQSEAVDRARHLVSAYGSNPAFDYLERDLTKAYSEFISAHFKSEDPYIFKETAFANGQLLSIVRTPFLYYTAALLQEIGYASITCGTTNRDEGGYIGFFGKASDAMVDLQPIGDIHKSEVYQVAHYLGVPLPIINEKPRGDVFDGRIDEEMIGTTYDNVEFFTLLLDFGYNPAEALDEEAISAIESIHAKNKHKYAVGLPARFVDVMKRPVKNGWN